MKLHLKNIGKIENATIELNGITVIAGENNSGKSTLGKTLFSVFNGFYNSEQQIQKERIQSVERILNIMHRSTLNRMNSRVDTEIIAESIVNEMDTHVGNPEILRRELLEAFVLPRKNNDNRLDDEKIIEIFDRVLEILKISNDEIFKTVLTKKLNSEFNGQVNNIYSEDIGTVDLTIKDETISISISENSVVKINKQYDLSTEVIYLDDPFVLDEGIYYPVKFLNRGYLDHSTDLKNKLFSNSSKTNAIDEIVTRNILAEIFQKINSVCDGDVVENKNTGWGYKKGNTDNSLELKNLSTGLKTFVILKMLLQKGILDYNGTIILDEPEIHLHPEWQLLFAELIVMIQKEFGMHVLLNTHSPYFLHAIEVYADKHKIADKCKYYLAVAKGDTSIVEDVSDNIESIYIKLARPLQDLENERYRHD